MGYSESDQFWALCNSISGQAIAAVASLPTDLYENQDHTLLRRILSKYFGVSSTPQVSFCVSFFGSHSLTSPSVTENSIRSLAAAAFPSDPMEAQRQAISAFIGGLANKTTAAVLLID